MVNTNNSLSLTPAKKTKKIALFDEQILEIQFLIRVCFNGLYVHPVPFLCPDVTYKTSTASIVCSRLNLDSDPYTCTSRGIVTFFKPYSKLSYSISFYLSISVTISISSTTDVWKIKLTLSIKINLTTYW